MLNGVGDISGNDFSGLETPSGTAAFDDSPITAHDIASMEPYTFEVFCAALWCKQGYQTYLTPVTGDGGIDVVAIDGNKGVLVQCKSSSTEGQPLGWDAVKDVAAGAAAYELKHSGITFQKVAVTNQKFNSTAQEQAALNNVELFDHQSLTKLLVKYPVKRSYHL
jgi:HJR/Mrr/RecB family endonuclease